MSAVKRKFFWPLACSLIVHAMLVAMLSGLVLDPVTIPPAGSSKIQLRIVNGSGVSEEPRQLFPVEPMDFSEQHPFKARTRGRQNDLLAPPAAAVSARANLPAINDAVVLTDAEASDVAKYRLTIARALRARMSVASPVADSFAKAPRGRFVFRVFGVSGQQSVELELAAGNADAPSAELMQILKGVIQSLPPPSGLLGIRFETVLILDFSAD